MHFRPPSGGIAAVDRRWNLVQLPEKPTAELPIDYSPCIFPPFLELVSGDTVTGTLLVDCPPGVAEWGNGSVAAAFSPFNIETKSCGTLRK